MERCAGVELDGDTADFIFIERPHVVVRWLAVVRHPLRIRRLQRIWTHLGSFLKNEPAVGRGLRCSEADRVEEALPPRTHGVHETQQRELRKERRLCAL